MTLLDAAKRMFLGAKKPPPDLDELPVWMDPIEQSQVHALIEALAPARVLEWGAGGSTRALLARSPFIERYVSVEHNAAWHDKVRAKVTDPRLELHLCEPDVPCELEDIRDPKTIAWHLRCEHEAELMRAYVALPRTLGVVFDFVLVDGRARNFCIREGFELLRPGGLLVLHDAQREVYHAAMNSIGRAVFLEPWAQGQICFVRKPDAKAQH